MFNNASYSSFSAIYLVCGYTDMRLGIDSLASIIETRYRLSLFVPNTLFLFCGRKTNRIKGLVWEGDGFLLFTKRVEDGRFSWPRTASEARQLTEDQFNLFRNGYSIDPAIRTVHPERIA